MAPSIYSETTDMISDESCFSTNDFEQRFHDSTRTSTPQKTNRGLKRKITDKQSEETENPTSKKRRTTSDIMNAVDKMSTDSDLIADASRENVLPTIPGKHSDLNAISPKTLSDVISGQYDSSIDHVSIIDCRYPYEYNGGHIEGAVNLYTKDMIQKFLLETVTDTPTVHVLIFHCEFSSHRGPKMYRFLRSLDRNISFKLFLVEMYLNIN